MDTRTDPGQYYPGGRVMVRPDVAPPQGRVRWGDIVGKPDFSDVATLEAEDSLGNVKINVNKIVDKMKTAVIVLMCGLSTALSALAATTLNGLPGTAEVYTAAETDAAIIRLAPAPGNYLAVSNAAMNAATPSITNGLVTASVTNGLVTASITNGLVTASITNGLVTASITNGLVTASITNDIATVVNTKQDKLPYPTNGIPYSVISDIPPPVTNRYPLFVIDLNPGEASVWQHIELKATTNNFENEGGMTFFTATTANGEASGTTFTYDWCRIFILSRRADSDIRKWVRIQNTGELGEYIPLSIAVVVDPAMFRRGQGSEWLHEGNRDLIWSYVRIDALESEKDQDGTPCWRPVMPSKWYAELPEWADAPRGAFDDVDVRPYAAPWEAAIAEYDTSYARFDCLTNVNQSVQYVTSTPSGTLDIKIPTGVARTKDWVVYCNFTAEKTPISLPAATWWMADAAYTNAIPANQPTALYFTQISDGVYMLSRQELTSVLIQTGE